MSIPGFVEQEVEIFPEVEASLVTYMRRKGCSFDMALSHALRALGTVDAAKQVGEKVHHVPGFDAQSELEVYQPIHGEEIHLEKIGQQINSQPRRIPARLHEKAYNSLRAYMQGYGVSQAIALMHATFLLVICQHGDLWVQQPGQRPIKVVFQK